jgi:hypothetical protein
MCQCGIAESSTTDRHFKQICTIFVTSRIALIRDRTLASGRDRGLNLFAIVALTFEQKGVVAFWI